MENASNALLIVAGMLIGIMILSIGVYLFATFSSSVNDTKEQILENKENQFNIQFLTYDGRTDLTIYDVMSLATLARENNQYYEMFDSSNAGNEGSLYVQVVERIGLNYGTHFEALDEEHRNNCIIENNNNIMVDPSTGEAIQQTYTCESVEISDITKRVYSIVLKKNN